MRHARSFAETIETARLRLRKPRRADADAIFDAYAQDADVTRYLVWRPHTSIAETRDFIADCLERWGRSAFPYVMTAREDGALIGMIEVRVAEPLASLGYVLAKRCWGRGLMPEAVRAVVSAAFASSEIDRVEAACDVDNLASGRVLEKAGFTRERRAPRYLKHPNISDEPRDCFVYAMRRSDRTTTEGRMS
jgi:RimJ/RimL family protein N-acetyltransferase